MLRKTDPRGAADDTTLSPRLLNSLMLILIGAALGLFWQDAVQVAARILDRLTSLG